LRPMREARKGPASKPIMNDAPMAIPVIVYA
jgi:hypothetical protein